MAQDHVRGQNLQKADTSRHAQKTHDHIDVTGKLEIILSVHRYRLKILYNQHDYFVLCLILHVKTLFLHLEFMPFCTVDL